MKLMRIAIGVCALVAFAGSCSHGPSVPPSTRVPSEFLSALLSDHWLDARPYLADDFLPGRTYGVVESLKMEHDALAREGIRSIGEVTQAGTRFDFRVVGRTAHSNVRATIQVWVSQRDSGEWKVSNFGFVAQSITFLFPSVTPLPQPIRKVLAVVSIRRRGRPRVALLRNYHHPPSLGPNLIA